LFILSLAVLCIGLACATRAAQVPDLYEAEVPVRTQAQAAREQAFRAALETVLIKITGSRSVADEPATEVLLNAPSNYVQQFGYRNGRPMTLWVQFDGGTLHDAVTEANLPIWMEERPAVLVWIAVQVGDARYLIDEDSNRAARRRVRAVGELRGLPVLLPLMDMEDRARVSVADTLAGFDEAVLEASARYDPDATAIARVTGVRKGVWRAQWRLHFGGESLNWDFRGATIGTVLTDGVHAIADALGARLAMVENLAAQGDLVVAVEGVDSLEDFARVRAYLKRLSQVQSSCAYRIEPGYASFRVRTSGDSGVVKRAVNLGDVLEEAPPPAGAYDVKGPPTLYFRLLR
jgi:hypothetical protein